MQDFNVQTEDCKAVVEDIRARSGLGHVTAAKLGEELVTPEVEAKQRDSRPLPLL